MNVEITADHAIKIIDSILFPPEPNEVEILIKNLKEVEAINDSEYKQSEEGEFLYIDIYGKSKLSDEYYNYIVKALKACKKCYHLNLDFTNCQFGQKISDILQIVSEMKQLKYFEADFNSNEIDSLISQDFSQHLQLNSNLETLKLRLKHNKLQEKGVIYLADAISHLSKLKTIEIMLYENQINNGMSYLIEKMSHIKTLTDVTLFFSKNNISDQQAVEIGVQLGKLSSVNKIFINAGWNQIGSTGLMYIAQGLQKIPNLYEMKIYLSSNQMTSLGFLNLLESVNQCQQLKYLEINLSGNQLEAGDTDILKDRFQSAFRDFNQNLKNLKYFVLYLRKNDLKSSFNPLFRILKQNKFLHHLILDYSFNNQILADRKKVETMMKKVVRLTQVIVHLDPSS